MFLYMSKGKPLAVKVSISLKKQFKLLGVEVKITPTAFENNDRGFMPDRNIIKGVTYRKKEKCLI